MNPHPFGWAKNGETPIILASGFLWAALGKGIETSPLFGEQNKVYFESSEKMLFAP